MDETTLRIILLMVGVAILLAIYFFDKYKNTVETDSVPVGVPEPVQPKIIPVISDELINESTVDIAEPIETLPNEAVSEPVTEQEEEESSEVVDVLIEPAPVEKNAVDKVEKLIQVALLAKADSTLAGVELQASFNELNLEFGDMGIFHRYLPQSASKEALFHVVNIMEPGAFPAGDMSDFETKGLMLFMQAGEVTDAVDAFEQMLAAAHYLCEQFNADLMDETMQPLTLHKISGIKADLSAASAV